MFGREKWNLFPWWRLDWLWLLLLVHGILAFMDPWLAFCWLARWGSGGSYCCDYWLALTPSRISTFINNTNTPCPLTLACCGVPEFHLCHGVELCQSRWRELPFTVTDTVQQHHGWTFQILKAAESRGNFKVPVVILINWYQLSESISSAQRRRYPHRLVGKIFGVSLYSLRWFITIEDEYHRLNKLFGCDFQETGLEERSIIPAMAAGSTANFLLIGVLGFFWLLLQVIILKILSSWRKGNFDIATNYKKCYSQVLVS